MRIHADINIATIYMYIFKVSYIYIYIHIEWSIHILCLFHRCCVKHSRFTFSNGGNKGH